MPDAGLRIRRSLIERLEAVARERNQDPVAILEEALDRYLTVEEHCEEMFRTYGPHLARRMD